MSAFETRPVRRRPDLTDNDLAVLATALREHRNARLRQLDALGLDGDAGPDLDAVSRVRARAVATAVLQQVDAALARLDDGTYGWCPRCLVAIDRERLHAVPYVTYCVPCASDR